VAGLVKQRLAWEAEYALGAEPDFIAFKEYKEKRLSEDFRMSSYMEKHFEYVINLERRLKEIENE
jgi:hypothetical protein